MEVFCFERFSPFKFLESKMAYRCGFEVVDFFFFLKTTF